MKKQQVDHVLRAAGRITGETQFIIIGSQSLHGKHPDLADDIVRSAEVDLIAKCDTSRTEWLNVIGQDSKFHDQFGYYADPVDETTATLPKGWKGRLVNLPAGDTEGVRGLCLDPHDLAPGEGSDLHTRTRSTRNRFPGTTTVLARSDPRRRRDARSNSHLHRH
jgi:hypothetical protein